VDFVPAGLAVRSGHGLPRLLEINLAAEESLPRLAQSFPLGDARDRLRRAVEGGDPPLGVDRDQPGPDRLEDQVPERLEIGKILALVLEAALGEVVAFRERTGQEGDREEHGRVQEDGEHLEGGRLERLRQSKKRQEVAPQHDVDVEEAREAGCHETAAPPEQVGAFEHRQHVEE
jgi:hypothetical protein